MFKSKKPGLAIVELIMVLAISAGLFVIVLSTFTFRQRSQSDDSARQVLSIIAKVRNEAIQGVGPTTTAGQNLLQCNSIATCPASKSNSNELFGQGIKFYTNNQGSISYMLVMKLMQNRTTGLISAYQVEQVKIPGGLIFYSEGSPTQKICSGFMSCYASDKKPDGTPDYESLFTSVLKQYPTMSTFLVFMNNSGQSYAFAINNYTNDTDGSLLPAAKFTSGTDPIGGYRVQNTNSSVSPDSIANYDSNHQGQMQLAILKPGSGSTLGAKVASSSAYYYINFDLSVPNNQSLQVVK